MISAMFPAIAHIKCAQYGMKTIGSNLSLINVNGAKGSRINYVEMGCQLIKGAQGPTTPLGGTDPVTMGFGPIVGSANVDTTQGALNITGVNTDLAIDGQGYLMFSDNAAGVTYSRDGALRLDANGDLCHASTGQRILGWTADNAGNLVTSSVLGPNNTINIPKGVSSAAQQTKNVTYVGNLAGNALNSFVYPVDIVTYDSLGNQNPIRVRFTGHTTTPIVAGVPANGIPAGAVTAGATSKWTWTANLVNPDGTETAIGDSTTAGNNPVYFDQNGNILNIASSAYLGTGRVTIVAQNGAAAVPMTLDFTALTQLGSNSQVTPKGQDGYGAGALSSYTIQGDGTITGMFNTGQHRTLGQVGISTFSNPAGLQKLGGNMLAQTNNSGNPVQGIATTGEKGTIKSGFLERSNIDFAEQFTTMIAEERGIQANTKMVTAIDELTRDLINMKR